MYGLELTIRPTGGLTFRRMPSGILHISTYPFLPPTTMSGWLRRLAILAGRGEIPDTAVANPDYLALPPDYHVLGAYPTPFHGERIHTTKRHGSMFQSKHVAFSRLHRRKADEGNNEKLQLHTWEYLLVDRLIGYVLHEEATPLEEMRELVNYGCKIGKEGFAYLEAVSPVISLRRTRATAQSATLLPGMDLIGCQGALYPLYRYKYRPSPAHEYRPAEATPSAIIGYVPFWAGWADEAVELDYWTDGRVYLPVSFVEALYGE